jgi:hypothetical protein
MGTKKTFVRREYGFDKMKAVGAEKKIIISDKDPIAGLRALTAAYAFARRHNEKVTRARKGAKIRFAGRTSATGKVMVIQRVK